MLPKYTVEYATRLGKHLQPNHYSTDDPVTCEEFVEELMEAGYPIQAIRHEGLELDRPEFDCIIKTAGSMLASRHICASLGIKPEEEHFRFGFSS